MPMETYLQCRCTTKERAAFHAAAEAEAVTPSELMRLRLFDNREMKSLAVLPNAITKLSDVLHAQPDFLGAIKESQEGIIQELGALGAAIENRRAGDRQPDLSEIHKKLDGIKAELARKEAPEGEASTTGAFLFGLAFGGIAGFLLRVILS